MNDGHIGEVPQYAKCPRSFSSPEETEAMQARVRMRQESVNKRFKQFGVLKQVFRHDIANHGEVCRAVAVLIQLAILNGEPLFSVGHKDPPFDKPCEVEDTESEWDGVTIAPELQAVIDRKNGGSNIGSGHGNNDRGK